MNILYFCQLYPPALYGGGEYIFFQWAKELVKRGHKVFTITQRLVGERYFEKVNGIYVYRVGPKIKYQGTLPLKVSENLGYITSAIIKGMFLTAKNGIDIIHSNTYAPALAGQVCATIFRKAHIITVHDVYFLTEKDFWNKWASQRDVAGSVAIVGPLIEKLILRLPAKVFHTVSETSKGDLFRSHVKKFVVISNGINLSDYDAIVSSYVNAHQAVYIGRLVFYKNLDTVIKSMKKVVEKIPDSKFVIIGDGPYREHLEGLVRNQRLMNNVIFTGRVSHKEKVKILKKSAFLVLPSVCEGFGITIIEGFACCKPALISDVMPLPEIVENDTDGFRIPPFNRDNWANALAFLFSHPNKTREMGMYGREKLKQKYTIQKIVDRLEQLYGNLIGNGVSKITQQ